MMKRSGWLLPGAIFVGGSATRNKKGEHEKQKEKHEHQFPLQKCGHSKLCPTRWEPYTKGTRQNSKRHKKDLITSFCVFCVHSVPLVFRSRSRWAKPAF